MSQAILQIVCCFTDISNGCVLIYMKIRCILFISGSAIFELKKDYMNNVYLNATWCITVPPYKIPHLSISSADNDNTDVLKIVWRLDYIHSYYIFLYKLGWLIEYCLNSVVWLAENGVMRRYATYILAFCWSKRHFRWSDKCAVDTSICISLDANVR